MRSRVLMNVRRGLFGAIILLFLILCTHVFQRKNAYYKTLCEIANEPFCSLDMVCFGSSHMYCTLCPILLYQLTGIRSYVVASQRQPLEVSQENIRRVLQRQKPKYVMLETFMLMIADPHKPILEAIVHDGIDGMPLDLGKMRLIKTLKLEDEAENYLFPLVKYHVRWKELGKSDFSLSGGPSFVRGFQIRADSENNSTQCRDVMSYEPMPVNADLMLIVEQIRRTVESAGSQLVLLTAPYPASVSQLRKLRYLHEYAREHNLLYIDLIKDFDQTRIDATCDFYSFSHLNLGGGEKATQYIAGILGSKFASHSICSAECISLWSKECKRYKEVKAAALATQKKKK